jgi:aminomethyltransferase
VPDLLRTPLYDLHVRLGGRLVGFAGYELPVRYGPGPIAEHHQARGSAALFDVSHMGYVEVSGPGAAAAIEALVPAAVTTLEPGRLRYTMFTTEAGGVIDDLMLARVDDDRLTLVVNAAGKGADVAHLRAGLPDGIEVTLRDDVALLALQGPEAAAALARLAPEATALTFLQLGTARIAGVDVGVSRSGYTGEDGFELAVPADGAVAVAEALLAQPEVGPAGLAARDSLRLEAGLCLYGHDLGPDITPVEAGLAWTIQKRRREEGGFPGAEVILAQLANGPPRHRIGLRADGRKPIREDAALRSAEGEEVGVVTSGGFGPSAGGPVAMGYVLAGHHGAGTPLVADVRGTPVAATVADLPFVAHRYHR